MISMLLYFLLLLLDEGQLLSGRAADDRRMIYHDQSMATIN